MSDNFPAASASGNATLVCSISACCDNSRPANELNNSLVHGIWFTVPLQPLPLGLPWFGDEHLCMLYQGCTLYSDAQGFDASQQKPAKP